MARGEPLISCSNVYREYMMGDVSVRALRGVNMQVHAGEILVILGPSGAGKSTLLHILGALDRPSAGEVRFRNRDISRLCTKEMARVRGRSFGFVFQFHHLIPELSVADNVMAPGIIEGSRRAVLRPRAMELLGELGLSARAEHMPSQISGGERQRVAVARALFNSPDVIFSDEPTGNLDTATGGLIRDLIVRLNRDRGVSFVIVTHDESFTELAARTVRLVDGQIA
jgi:lipoprotein-releasing system ATP-binding protein